jgi:hypothetical protein
MFEGWENFFLMAGGAAAVLIGLIFVVISLMGDRPRAQVLVGSQIYMGPIVLGVSFVLALSAAALTPGIGRCAFAAVTGLVAVWGLVRGIMSAISISRFTKVHWTDLWFYGVYPCAIYIAFGAVAIGFWMEWRWAHYGLAVAIVLALLLAIRNEWDLITWITPRGEDGEHGEELQ